MSMTTESHEERVLVAQSDPARERMDLDPSINRTLHRLRDGHLTLAATLPADEQAVVPRV